MGLASTTVLEFRAFFAQVDFTPPAVKASDQPKARRGSNWFCKLRPVSATVAIRFAKPHPFIASESLRTDAFCDAVRKVIMRDALDCLIHLMCLPTCGSVKGHAPGIADQISELIVPTVAVRLPPRHSYEHPNLSHSDRHQRTRCTVRSRRRKP